MKERNKEKKNRFQKMIFFFYIFALKKKFLINFAETEKRV